MKTPVQELYDEYLKVKPLGLKLPIDIDVYLEKERLALVDSFNEGYRNGESDGGIKNNHKDISEFANAEQYYKEKFQQ